MKTYINRHPNNIEGLTNIFVSLFGIKAACRMKDAVGRFCGMKNYKEKKKLLIEWDRQCGYLQRELFFRRFDKIIACNNSFSIEWIQWFYKHGLTLKKDVDVPDDAVVVVCVVKDELVRMKKYLEYYRGVCDGVRFFITDNASTDGTYEFLLGQEDVRLYSTGEEFRSFKQVGWENAMMAMGGARWYLVADCDEFIVYPGMGDITLNEYVKRLYSDGRCAVKAVMLDMYPKEALGSNDISPESFLDEYVYHDDESEYYYNPDRNEVGGGYHDRLFGEKNSIRTKTPLFFMDGTRFLKDSHHMVPLEENLGADFEIFLLHYKFIPGDAKKIRNFVKTGVYANGSRLYKMYQRLFDEDMSLYCEHSKRFEGQRTLEEFMDVIRGMRRLKG